MWIPLKYWSSRFVLRVALELLGLALATAIVLDVHGRIVAPWIARSQTADLAHLPLLSVGDVVRGSPRAPMSLMLIISPQCPYCIASRDFYSKLSQMARERGVPILVNVPSVRGSKNFLKESGLLKAQVHDWRDSGVRVLGTPTIVVLDSAFTVRKMWVGEIPPTNERDLLDIVQNGLTTPNDLGANGVSTFPSSQLPEMRSRERITVLDVRERDQYKTGHLNSSVNIPYLELAVRAPKELDTRVLVAVNCANVPDSICKMSVVVLRRYGFRSAAIDGDTFFF
jgi:rhodanese-related sulfurtransferase